MEIVDEAPTIKMQVSKELFNKALEYCKNGPSFNEALAFEYFKLAGQYDNRTAIAIIANYYFEGKYVEKDVDKALELIKFGVRKENQLSKTIYAKILFKSKKDEIGAKRILEQLTDEGHGLAAAYLGYMHFHGIACQKDFFTANNLFHKALAKSHGKEFLMDFIYSHIGLIYLNGLGEKKNVQKAVEYFELGVKHHELRSMEELGKLYLVGDSGFPAMPSRALQYLELAVNNSGILCLQLLGDMFFEGNGVPEDQNLALRYYERYIRRIPDYKNIRDQFFQTKNIQNFVDGQNKDFIQYISGLPDVKYDKVSKVAKKILKILK